VEGCVTVLKGGLVRKEKKGIQFLYRFAGRESKRFSWNFASVIDGFLKIAYLPQNSMVKLHTMALAGLNLRDSAAIYSRVEIENCANTTSQQTACC